MANILSERTHTQVKPLPSIVPCAAKTTIQSKSSSSTRLFRFDFRPHPASTRIHTLMNIAWLRALTNSVAPIYFVASRVMCDRERCDIIAQYCIVFLHSIVLSAKRVKDSTQARLENMNGNGSCSLLWFAAWLRSLSVVCYTYEYDIVSSLSLFRLYLLLRFALYVTSIFHSIT